MHPVHPVPAARPGLSSLLRASLRWKAIHANAFEATAVNLSAVGDLDLAFYERTTAEMAELGYQPLADVEYRHVTNARPELRTGLRVFGCGHGQIYAAAFHVRVRGWRGMLAQLAAGAREFRVIEFESALNDGRFVSSSTIGLRAKPESAPRILKFAYPPDTPLGTLEQNHIANVQQLMVGENPPAPLVVKKLDALMEMQEVQHRIENGNCNKIGPLNNEESKRLGPDLPRREREALMAEMEKLRAEVQSAG